MSVSETERAEAAGLHVVVDGSAPLSPETTALIGKVCDELEDARGGGAFAVLHVENGEGGPAAGWPGPAADVNAVNKWEGVLRRLERAPGAVLVTASGDCSGAALDVLLAADCRIVTAGTRLRLPTAEGQVWPGMAVHRLARQLGVARARRLVLLGAGLTAEEGLAAGLVDRVVPDGGALDAAVAEATAPLAGVDGTQLAIRRRLLLDAAVTGFEESLGSHLAACDRMLRQLAAGR
ncbi:enoyl-CoA-hydratase DpgB [Streptomyces albidoflavus]